MATLMQKDVLIEHVAYKLAFLFKTKMDKISEAEYSNIRDQLLDVRDYLYSTKPDEIDYNGTISKLNSIF